VGGDWNLFSSYWTLLEDVTDPNEMSTEDPVCLHGEVGVTGVVVIPSNAMPSRDVVMTAGMDGKLKISNLLSFGLDGDEACQPCVETSIGTEGAVSRLLGPILVREHYIPSAKDALDSFDPASLIPEDYESDDEDYVSGAEEDDQQEYNPDADPNYVDPDAGAGVPMDEPETDSGMGPLQNSYFVLAGETSSGLLSMLKVGRPSTKGDGDSETWTLNGVAGFDGHQGGKLGAMDVYKVDESIRGASASAVMVDGEPSMTVCAWLFEP
jgi:hypothetical protein